mmetsp:Transcript_35667/g.84663  ORF Transcript_35667/g.84663 Transcript_35667/m.84663 type:complete len:174 (-) Transcript_35667:216-737(-)
MLRSAVVTRAMAATKTLANNVRGKAEPRMRMMSTDGEASATAAKMAIIGLSFGCFALGYRAMLNKRDNKQNSQEVIVVGSEEEMHMVRKQRFDEGMKEAVVGAGIWGGSSIAILYGMRPAEPYLFGTNHLFKAGTPRLWWIITAMTLAGFAIHGETTLTHHGRQVMRIEEKKE